MPICNLKSRKCASGGIASYSLEQQERYTVGDLNAMTIAQIKSLAVSLDYSIEQTKKADIVSEFLSQQEAVR